MTSIRKKYLNQDEVRRSFNSFVNEFRFGVQYNTIFMNFIAKFSDDILFGTFEYMKFTHFVKTNLINKIYKKKK